MRHQGARRVIVSPFFLSPGRHWNQLKLQRSIQEYHMSLQHLLPHELLVIDVMNDRIKHCLSHIAGKADECSVCAGTGKCQLRQ
ncbi:hypothetical protein HAX54_049646 [Datura stramonium]|uniref:Uncharacterized protein n=1 Tax=Datura stramonium TaxID=4076 RepID=A0ABS8SVZ2_DATST|nr:hypothetical protein [Datura stramonium]